MFCNKCGARLKDDVKYCSECGNKVDVSNNDNNPKSLNFKNFFNKKVVTFKEKIDEVKERNDKKFKESRSKSIDSKKKIFFGKYYTSKNNVDPKNVKIAVGWIIFVLGLLAIIGSFSDFSFYNFICYILLTLFGFSLLPMCYNLLGKTRIKKIASDKSFQIIMPIILGIIFLGFVINSPISEIYILDPLGTQVVVNNEYKMSVKTDKSSFDLSQLKYVSSDESVATVDKNGLITGVSEGVVEITVSHGSLKTSSTYNVVYVKLNSISIDDMIVNVEEDKSLVYNFDPSINSDKIIQFSSSDENIFTIDNNGMIKGNNKGIATVTLTSKDGITVSKDVRVVLPIKDITINEQNASVEATHSINLSSSYEPLDADTDFISWSSSNPYVASVDRNGVVTTYKEGSATITVTSNGVSASSTINVFEIKPESVTLNKSELSLSVGHTATLSTTINPSNSSNKTISWSSSNFLVASVDSNGVVTANKRGTATIYATASNGVKATCLVSVTQVAPIKISKFRYNMDYVCGVQWTFNFKNNSGKTINYVTFKWYNLNGVGDFVYDEISMLNYTAVKYTGPLYNGKSSGDKVNTTKFYNCSYKSSTMSEINITFEDGSTETIKNSEFNQYTNLFN